MRRCHRGLTGVLLIALASVLAYACTDDPASPSVGDDAPARLEVPGSRGGVMSARLARQARAVAMALGRSRDLQESLHRLMEESPYAESKLEFRAVLDDEALGLGRALAGTDGRTAAAVRAAADSIGSLELYFPVDEHREQWRPGEPFIVASLLSDADENTLAGFDPDGRPVDLRLDAPPSEPTLVLVPAETDFTSIPAAEPRTVASLGRGGAPMMSPGSDGLWMTYSSLPDLHEPWANGDPEIAVHIAMKDPVTDSMVWIVCAGDDASGDYYFDQNSTTWSGTVKLGSKALLEDKEFEVFVLEDDYKRCTGTGHLTPNTGTSVLNTIKLTDLKSLLGVIPDWGGGTLTKISIIATVADLAYKLVPALNEDDIIGVARNIYGNCFVSATGPVQYTLTDTNGDPLYAARIYMDDDFDDRVLCDLEVNISGPSQMLECDFGLSPAGTFYAQYTGGSGTPSYKWWENEILRGTSSSYNLYDTGIGPKKIELQVTRGTEQVHAILNASVQSSEGREHECLESP